jgi:hypothetical protein
MEMDFPPNWTRKEKISPCGLNNHRSNVVNKVGEGERSGEPIVFQQDRDMTNFKDPSSTTVLLIMCFTYTTSI